MKTGIDSRQSKERLAQIALAMHNWYFPFVFFGISCMLITALTHEWLLPYAIVGILAVLIAPYALALLCICLASMALIATVIAIALCSILKSIINQFKHLGW